MNIIFEDNEIIVCIKPIGVVSQFSESEENMVTILQKHCNSTIYPLHRLDKEVGGIMVFAKTKKAAAILSCDIAEHRLWKEYLALIHGEIQEKTAILKDYLFKDSRKNKSFVVKSQRKGVKQASLEYEVLNVKQYENEKFSVVRVLLHTGRTHQIRVQFSSRGHSLAGDKKYGGKDNFKAIGLWSYKLTFNHPITKEKLEFSAEPQNIIKEFT